MNSSKAEAENIEPSAGKEMLDKYWAEIKTEIDDINIVSNKIRMWRASAVFPSRLTDFHERSVKDEFVLEKSTKL